jgi:hypothetical protein
MQSPSPLGGTVQPRLAPKKAGANLEHQAWSTRLYLLWKTHIDCGSGHRFA